MAWQLAWWMAIYRGLWNSIFQADFHPIRECMFRLSFFTILNIYKDYFESRKRLQKLHKSTIPQVWRKVWPETYFALIHLSLEEAAIFVHRRVLWPSNFMIFIVCWIEELCSQHPSQVSDQVAYWDPRNWLVTYWEPCITRRDCHYRRNPIGYWGKDSTVGWYKVLGFFYM